MTGDGELGRGSWTPSPSRPESCDRERGHAGGFFGSWIQVGGDVEIISLPQALEPLVEYYRAVSGEHDDWAEYRAAMVRERRCLLRLQVTSAGPDAPR